MSDQRRRRWSKIVEMLKKCFVLAGIQMYPSTTSSNKYGLTLYGDNTSNTVKGELNDIFLV